MNFVYVLIAVLALGGGYYLYSNSSSSQILSGSAIETAIDTETETEEEKMSEEEHDGTDMHDVAEEATTNMPTMEDPETDEMDIAFDDPNAKVFNIGGQNFAFDVTEIKVKEGDTVTINFTSTGGFHDWVVDEFDAASDRVQTDETSSVTFVAKKAGTYEYYCSVGSHRANGMVGTLVVE